MKAINDDSNVQNDYGIGVTKSFLSSATMILETGCFC